MFDRVEKKLAISGRRISERLYDRAKVHEEVGKAMRGLLANPGVGPLRAQDARRAREYASDVFGGSIYAPWLIFYATYRGEFLEGWVPDNFFQGVAVMQINGKYHRLDDSRSLFARLLGADEFPDVAHFVSGEWRDPAGALLDPGALEEVLFQRGDRICVKVDASSRGRGVSILTRETFDRADIEQRGNLVVQSFIRQGEILDSIFSAAVATLRITTGKTPGARPAFIGSYLRVGRGRAQIIDKSSLRAPVVDAIGTLGPVASDADWRRFETHPDTGFRFDGARVPEFQHAVARCLTLHDRLPQLGLIGWDVAIDDAGAVQIMEVNTGHPDIKFTEMTTGPSLRQFQIEQYAGGKTTAASASREGRSGFQVVNEIR